MVALESILGIKLYPIYIYCVFNNINDYSYSFLYVKIINYQFPND